MTDNAECVGCGCTDMRPCLGGCCWLAIDRDHQSGVCSNCPRHLTAWRNQRAEVGQRDKQSGQLGLTLIGPTDI